MSGGPGVQFLEFLETQRADYRLGAGARALELAVRRLLECDASPSRAQRAEIDAAMREMKDCIPLASLVSNPC